MLSMKNYEAVAMTYSYDDRGRDSERPVRLDKTEGHVIIEGRTYPAKEIVEALAQSGYVEMRAVGDSLVLGRKRITPIFKSSQERAMAALCHGSLAYCCPLSKRCAERDRALEILGLTNSEYENLKGDEHHKFIIASRGIPNEDSFGSAYVGDGRLANQPARDPGYGSDDYRRDFDTLDRALRGDDHQDKWQEQRSPWYENERTQSQQQRIIRSGNPFTDIDDKGRMTSENRSGNACQLRDDSIEGLGSLFQQGELSPFKDDRSNEKPSFCFSCGRSIDRGTDVCSYCGARQ